MRFLYDRERKLVSLMLGSFCLDRMSLTDYADTFGVRAAARLLIDWDAATAR